MKRAILIYMMLCLVAPITIEAKKKPFGDGLYWELSNDGTLTISGNGDMPDFDDEKDQPWHLPFIKGKIRKIKVYEGVRTISENAFCNWNEVKKEPYSIPNIEVSLPSSIKRINDFAFFCLPTDEIELQEGLEYIGIGAFSGSSIISIDLPNTVKAIGQSCFLECESLEDICLSDNITIIPNQTFQSCFKLFVIHFPKNLKVIGDKSFYSCGIKNNEVEELSVQIELFKEVNKLRNDSNYFTCINNLTIPNSVNNIGNEAFFNTTIDTLSISQSVNSIGKNAFGTHFKGVIQCLPHLVTSNNANEFGLSTISVNNYYNSVRNNKGFVILASNEDRIISTQTDQYNNKHYYIIEEKGEKGLMNSEGKWIIHSSRNNLNISLAGNNYFRVKNNNNYYSIIDKDGRVIIPSTRKYTSISDFDIINKSFNFTKLGYTGICNAKGDEISINKLPPSKYDIISKGSYVDATEIMNGGQKYYKVSKGGRYGLTDAEGKQIIAPELDAVEQAGVGFLRFKINGFWGVMNYAGKIIIPTDRGYTKIGDYVSFTKRFPYEMNGFKGECDQTGKQISKISTTTSQKQSVSAKESTPQKQEGEQKIIIEHKHDPVPMQVWVQCTICYGSGMCQSGCGGSGWFTGWSGNSSRCIGCGGSGRCQFCAGQGGHYEVQYK